MDKPDLRERIWDALEESGEARFPFPPHGRIPNFAGAIEAAERLSHADAWRDAAVIKANPDAPQRPVRRRALAAGKTVFVAVPRLREAECFLRLDPTEIEDIDHATTIGGAGELGEPTDPRDMEPVDLVACGSVAVSPAGARVGKGEGYSDLEFALLRSFDRVTGATPVATTVHDVQVVDESIPVAPHDVPVDLIATPTRLVRTDTPHERPAGIDWGALDAERIKEIPILDALRPD